MLAPLCHIALLSLSLYLSSFFLFFSLFRPPPPSPLFPSTPLFRSRRPPKRARCPKRPWHQQRYRPAPVGLEPGGGAHTDGALGRAVEFRRPRARQVPGCPVHRREADRAGRGRDEIGRASCRERV